MLYQNSFKQQLQTRNPSFFLWNMYYSNNLCSYYYNAILNGNTLFVDMCSVPKKRRTSNLNVIGSRPPLVTRCIRCVLLFNRTNNLNRLSWLLIY